MLFSTGRAAIQRLASTSSRRVVVPRQVAYVTGQQLGFAWSGTLAIRTYAASAAAAGAKTSGTKKKTEKTSATKTKTKTKTKPPKKQLKKPQVKDAKPKPKKKPSQKSIDDQERRELKAKTLYTEEPGRGILAPWQVYTKDLLAGMTGEPSTTRMSTLAVSFKKLSSSELQQLQEKTDAQNLERAAEYERWVEQHSVETIMEANKARKTLKRKYQFPKSSRKTAQLIKDDRQPKRPVSAYALFTKAKYASGDMTMPGGKPADLKNNARVLAGEWKKMSAAEKQPYYDLHQADHDRYAKETKSVLQT